MIKIQAEEKDIEDILEKHCEEFLGLRFIARQISTPAGIVDMLAYHKELDVYYIIEIKKGQLDSHAMCQVLRYSNYFNANKSKYGERVFLPLIIGSDLREEMHKSVFKFNKGHHKSSYGKVLYALFNLDPFKGVSFDYVNSMQSEYEDTYLFQSSSYVDKLTCDVEEYESDKEQAEWQRQQQAQVNFEVIKGGK